MTRTIGIAAMGLLLLWLCVCSDDDDITNSQPDYVVKIVATDAASSPVENLRVSMWHHMTPPVFSGLLGRILGPTEPAFSTGLVFALPVACSASLEVRDIAGHRVSLLHDEYSNAGVYNTQWSGLDAEEALNDGVYQFILRAAGDAGEVLFQDTVLAVLWQPDPDVSILGYTNSVGTLTCEDSLRFPNLFTLPELLRTNEIGVALGEFRYTDTITIVLTDTISGASQEFTKTVESHGVDINLTWDPPPATAGPREPGDRNIERPRRINETQAQLPTEFYLGQNFPNPFN